MVGLYKIVCNVNGKVYYGSSIKSIEHRWGEHKRQLNEGKHHCWKLQLDWNEYGPDAFEFHMMKEMFFSDDIILAEQQLLDTHWGTTLCYNVSKSSDRTAGRLGLTNTPEHRKKISQGRRGQPGTPKTKEQKQKQKERMKEYWESDEGWEMRKRCAEASRNRVLTEEASHNIKGAQASEYYGFVSPDGKLVDPVVDLKQFCTTNQLHLASMINLFKGRKKQYKGWTVNHTVKYQLRYGRNVQLIY